MTNCRWTRAPQPARLTPSCTPCRRWASVLAPCLISDDAQYALAAGHTCSLTQHLMSAAVLFACHSTSPGPKACKHIPGQRLPM